MWHPPISQLGMLTNCLACVPLPNIHHFSIVHNIIANIRYLSVVVTFQFSVYYAYVLSGRSGVDNLTLGL